MEKFRLKVNGRVTVGVRVRVRMCVYMYACAFLCVCVCVFQNVFCCHTPHSPILHQGLQNTIWTSKACIQGECLSIR